MQRHQNGHLPYLRFSIFPQDGRQRHAVFTRKGGVSPVPFATLNLSVSVPDERTNVLANRRRAYGLFNRDTDTVVHAHLVHGHKVARVTRVDDGSWIPHVDGIVTDEPGCALTMNYADCAPILLYDPQHRAIGVGHAGWKGAVADLPGALVRAMQREFATDPGRLLAAVGPCIDACCYEVGEPVISDVRRVFEEPDTLLLQDGGSRPHFDLPEANRRRLARAGVRNVEMSGLCTACRTDLFFSHRAEQGRTGRFGAIFLLQD